MTAQDSGTVQRHNSLYCNWANIFKKHSVKQKLLYHITVYLTLNYVFD